MISNLKKFWILLAGNRMAYLLSILAIALGTLFSFVMPLIIRFTIDSVLGNKPVDFPEFIIHVINATGGTAFYRDNLWVIAIILVSVSIIEGAFTFLKGRFASHASESFARKLRDKLYDHLQRLPFAYHAKVETGDLIQRCTSDVETIRRFLGVQFIEVGRAIIMLALVIPIMLSLDVGMTLVSLAVVPIIFCFAIVFFLKVKAAFQMSDEAEGEMSTVLQENLTGIRVVRAFARQNFEFEKFDAKNSNFRDLTYRLILLLAWYWSISDFVCLLQIAAVLVVGAFWAAAGTISLGTLVVFITYVGKLLWPVRQMGRILTDLGKALVSLGRISEILEEPIEDTTAKIHLESKRIRGEVTFRNVTFGYEPNQTILKDISFTVKPGQTVALLGPTGSGKTTLVNLIPRLYDYQQGSITIDGQELKDMNRYEIRRQIGIVLQEPFLFSKNLRDNIRLANHQADEGDVFEAARAASVHDVILEFEEGYETVVGERGVTLSGGQKQRVAMARAIIQDPAILIFDDSLSAVDTETETRIQEALRNRRGRSTTFVIAHRMTTIAQADLVLVIKDGRIIQSGNHESLVKQPGLYQKIWTMQSSITEDIESEFLTFENDDYECSPHPGIVAERKIVE